MTKRLLAKKNDANGTYLFGATAPIPNENLISISVEGNGDPPDLLETTMTEADFQAWKKRAEKAGFKVTIKSIETHDED